MAPEKPGHFRVVFGDAWEDDVRASTPAARTAAQRIHAQLARDGVRASSPPLRRCDPAARDGTRLQDCFKLYVPDPANAAKSPWGIVFAVAMGRDGRPFLQVLSFGLRHPPMHSRRPSVYRLADRRLHS